MLCPLQARRCGGCTRLSVPYDQQLKAKQKKVQALFPGIAVPPVTGMKDPFHYRNKVIAAYAHGPKGLISGMYAYGTHYVLPCDRCLLENERADQILCALRDILQELRVQAYDENKKTGLIRFAQVRYAERTRQALVTIVTAQSAFPGGKEAARRLMDACPDVRTVVQNVNPRPGSAVLGFEEHILSGSGTIEDIFAGKTVRLSSRSFYQINTSQAEKLYRAALSLSKLRAEDKVLDVYCGIGLIGLLAADTAAQVTGIEINPSAVQNARQIARMNGARNIHFVQGDASLLSRQDKDISLVILDPPRAGLDPKALSGLTALMPERICYISCNPVTQARDLQPLLRAGYRLEALQPVDMFPHTDHVETVCLLTHS